MKKNVSSCGSVWVALLIFCACVMLFQGCSRTRPAGMEMVESGDRKFLLITADTGHTGQAQVAVRHLIKDKATGQYVTAQEYLPTSLETENTFGLVVDETGIYQVTATCGDLSPVTHTVEISKNQVYVLNLIFSVPQQEPQETGEALTPNPDQNPY